MSKFACFLLGLLVLVVTTAHADLYRKWGYVQARGQVLGPNDQPVLVEVDQQGNELREVGEVYGPLEGVFMMSAFAYRTAVEQYNQLMQSQQNGVARGAVILSTYKGEGAQVSEYQSYCQGLPPVRVPAQTPDAQPVNKKIPCPPVDDTAVRSVVLRHPSTILDPDLLGEDGPILLRSPVDLRDRRDLSDNFKTVLLTPAGQIARQAQGGGMYENTVTYKWNYFQPDAEGNQPGFYGFTDDITDRVLSPLPGVKVSQALSWFGFTQSDEDGKYRLEYYLPPCPCFTYDYNGKILGEVPYKNFNPKSKDKVPFGTYTVYSQTFDFCNGMAQCPLYPGFVQSAVAGIIATQATPMQPRQDLKVDAVMLTGEGRIDVPIGDTAYDQERAGFDVQNPDAQLAYDFDGDRQPDKAVLHNGQYYVYLGGRSPEYDPDNPAQPINEDLKRRPDYLPDFNDRGLLQSISLEDLEQTDLYVFRASTGQLILERLGLKQDEYVPYNGIGADTQSTDSANFYYKFLIRGPRGIADLLTGSLSDWWSKAGIKQELFEQNKADFLRSGEMVQIVAINRPTGYVGSVTAPLQLNNENAGRTTLDVPIDRLVLEPPNLKIRVERQTETQLGLTKGEINQYLIGSEGAGLQSDQYIKITSEWLNPDGTPLPEELPGYSGLLAKVVAPGQVAVDGACGSQASKIPIKPGFNLQLLKLNGDCDIRNEHYYVYVCGNNPDDTEGQANCFNFGTQPDGRPSRYVPVKVPVFDEIASRKLENAYRYARQDELLPEDSKAPEPVYKWHYRPEMQFSVYELNMQSISRILNADTPEEKAVNVLDVAEPYISTTDDFVDVFYSLFGNESEPLAPFGPNRELVFILGEDEQIVTIGEDRTIRFENIEHIESLDATDYLTIRLVANNDIANVLWEWAFDGLFIIATEEDEFNENEIDPDKYYLFADNPVLELASGVISVISGLPEDQQPPSLKWTVEGDGGLDKPITNEPDQLLHTNRLVMPAIAGATGTVKVQIVGDNAAETTFREVVVLPGEPALVTISTSGRADIQGAGEILVTARITDKNGNIVADGTPVNFEINGSARLFDAQYLTTDGFATAVIKGGFVPEPSGTVFVASGNAHAQTNFAIGGVQAELLNVPESPMVNEYYHLTLKLRDSQGQPRSDIFADVTTTRGKLAYSDQNFKSDVNGELHFLWHSGWSLGEAVITARIGAEQLVRQTIIIAPEEGLPANYVDILPDDALVIGDESSDGIVEYDDLNGNQIDQSFPYSVFEELSFQGSPGGSVEVTLGTPAYPNRLPGLKLRGNRFKRFLYFDDTGQHKLSSRGLRTVFDHPSRIGRSLEFKPDDDDAANNASLNVSGDNLTTPEEWRWSFWVKPIAAGGTLLSFADAQVINVTQAGELSLTVTTANGSQTITSEPVALNVWHQVVAEVNEGSLSLRVDAQSISAALAGQMLYSSSPIDSPETIVIGDGADARLADLAFYDLDQPPLLQFADGGEQVQLLLDSSGNGSVTIKSNGLLKYPASQNALRSMLVEVSANETVSAINIISKQEYRELASLSFDILGSAQSFDRFKELYAGGERYGSENTLAERLLAFAMDQAAVDIHIDGYKELTAIKGVLSLLRRIPEAKVLVPHVQHLIDFFEAHEQVGSGSTLLYAAADEIHKHIKPVLRGQSVDLNEIALPLLILGEMIETNPLAAERVASTIVSGEDFRTWMRFMSLPAEGWVGLRPPVPPLRSQCGDSVDYQVITSTPELAMPLLPCRLTGQQVGEFIDFLFNDSPELNDNPEMLPPVLYELLEHIHLADMSFRKFLFYRPSLETSQLSELGIVDEAHAVAPLVYFAVAAAVRYAIKKAAKATVKKAAKNLVSFMLGKSNSRIQPLVLLSAIGYLETRMIDNACRNDGDRCVPIAENVIRDPIKSLENKILLNVLFKGALSDEFKEENPELECGFTYATQGAAFELFMTAFFHLMDEQLKLTKYKILELQRHNKVAFLEPRSYLDAMSTTNAKNYATITRYTDIVVKGDDPGGLPIYVELKSYPAHDNRPPKDDDALAESKVRGKFPIWKKTGTTKRKGESQFATDKGKVQGTTLHRQVLADILLTLDNFQSSGRPNTEKRASDFVWYFQDWKPSRRQSRNVRFRHPGNPITRIKVSGEGNETVFEYMRRVQLSSLGKDTETKKFVAWNFGRKIGDLGKLNDTGPLFGKLYPNDEGGGLKKRVKEFSLIKFILGEVEDALIDKEQMKSMLKNGLGLNDDVLAMIENPERYEEIITEHLENLGDEISEGLSKYVGLEKEEVKEVYNEFIEELQKNRGKFEETFDEALNELIDILPDSDGGTCL